ncbi:MAG: aminotransferase class I/II-fold pyridoxal phosphate-dependent enzyme [Actinomycetales bacterium]
MDASEAPEAPLLAAWQRARARTGEFRPMQIPGHKYRYSRDEQTAAPGYALLTQIIGDDIALQGGVDDNALSGGFLPAAERCWASAVGATHARFLVGGSSQGNLGMVPAVAGDGQRIAIDRSSHRSVLGGLVIAGAEPVWIQPNIHPEFGIPMGVSVAAVAALSGVAGLLITTPSYVGTLADTAALAKASHKEASHKQGFALLVDQAWGAHLGFLPGAGAIAQGADVSVTSVHKTLLGYSQTAVVTLRSDLLEASTLDRCLDLVGTTSPSGTLLASIDATRAVLQEEGPELWERVFALAEDMRAALRREAGIVVLDERELGQPFDPLKVTLWLPRTGATGPAVAARLREQGIGLEAADTDTLVLTISPADAPDHVRDATDAVRAAIDANRAAARSPVPTEVWQVVPEVVISPRAAFMAARRRMPLVDAVGEVSAEQFCPYPPGVPLLAPGERVTAEIIEAIRSASTVGRVAYCSDPTTQTIEVVSG